MVAPNFASPVTTALFMRTPEQCEAWTACEVRQREGVSDPTVDVTPLVNGALYATFISKTRERIIELTIDRLAVQAREDGFLEPTALMNAHSYAKGRASAELRALDKDYRRKQSIAARIPLFPGRQFARLPGERGGLF